MDDFLSSPNQSTNPFLEACYDNDVKKVADLLDRGEDINTKAAGQSTALHIAAQSGFLDLTNILIYRGANVNALNDDGWTPLHFSANKGYVDISIALIKAGVNVNIQGQRYHRTALHYAVDQNRVEAVELLLKSGADKNLKDIAGKTALDIATQKGFSALVDLLTK